MCKLSKCGVLELDHQSKLHLHINIRTSKRRRLLRPHMPEPNRLIQMDRILQNPVRLKIKLPNPHPPRLANHILQQRPAKPLTPRRLRHAHLRQLKPVLPLDQRTTSQPLTVPTRKVNPTPRIKHILPRISQNLEVLLLHLEKLRNPRFIQGIKRLLIPRLKLPQEQRRHTQNFTQRYSPQSSPCTTRRSTSESASES